MTAILRTTRAVQAVSRTQTARFSVVACKMAGGDAGAPRSGGAASGDAFTKREEASENLYIKQHEAEKVKNLKAKIAKQEQELAKNKDTIADLEGKK